MCSRRCGAARLPQTRRLRLTAAQRRRHPVPRTRRARPSRRRPRPRRTSVPRLTRPTPAARSRPPRGIQALPRTQPPRATRARAPRPLRTSPRPLSPAGVPQPALGAAYPDDAGGLPPDRACRRPPPEPPSPAGTPPPAAGGGDAGPDDGARDLPRRVKQASLAPQLRDNPPRRRTSAGAGAAGADGPTPDELRKTMSALQRGWQEGRSQPMSAPAAGDPPPGPSGQSQPEDTGGQRPAAADEPPGGSDGT